MNILFIGDIVGEPGREAVGAFLPALIREREVGFVAANAENAAGGSGITRKIAEQLFSFGVDVLTSGDHIWKKKEIFEYINAEPRVLRPVNFPAGAPGAGDGVFTARSGQKVGVVNVNGRVFLQPLECPFRTTRAAVERLRRETPVVLVDIHAEATSEKVALGRFLDGEVSAVVGTHTHIQTADECILPKRTAYITDLGMTGPYDSVLGRSVDSVLEKFLTGIPRHLDVAQGDAQLCGALIEVDEASGRALSIERILRKKGHD